MDATGSTAAGLAERLPVLAAMLSGALDDGSIDAVLGALLSAVERDAPDLRVAVDLDDGPRLSTAQPPAGGDRVALRSTDGTSVGWLRAESTRGELTADETEVVAGLREVIPLLHGLVADRARAELERRRFELLATTVSDSFWDWDLRTGVVWRNEALHTVFGYPTATLEPSTDPWHRVLHPEDRDHVVASLRDAIDGGDAFWELQYRIVRADGSVAHVLDRNHIVRDAEGRATRVVGAISDISDQWEARAELEASEARFRALAEQSSEGIFLQRLAPDVAFEYLNPAMEAAIGYPREQLYADPRLLLDAINEQDRARMWASLDSGGPVSNPVDVDLRRPDGEVRRLRLRGTPLRDETGRVVAIQAAATDVTREHREREAMESALERLAELNDLKTGFVQAVSHELRTPLTTIAGFVELLLAQEVTPEQQRVYLERVAAGAARLQRIVGDVLDLDRLDHADARIGEAEVDLVAVVERVVAELDTDTHPLHLELAPAVSSGDAGLLERVVDNLLRNARKHTPPGTPVWVRTAAPATIVVEDAGPGIPAELHELVFEPFRQGPNQLGHHSPGTGIGLALARRIVHLHGGTITAEARPGGGLRVVVRLTSAPPDATPVRSPAR